MDAYFSEGKSSGIPWVNMIRKLEERDFIEVLKYDPQNPNSVQIRNLKIKEKFTDLIFCDSNEVWKKFYTRYPSKGISGNESFIANMLDPKSDDEKVFKTKILKGANKAEADKILYFVEEMFDFDPIRQRPQRFASVGISKFIHNWDEILRQWLENEAEKAKGDWTTRMY